MRKISDIIQQTLSLQQTLSEDDRLGITKAYKMYKSPKQYYGITDIEIMTETGDDNIPLPKTIWLIRDLAKITSRDIEYNFVTGTGIATLPKNRDLLFKDAKGTLFLVDETGQAESLEMETIAVKAPYFVATLDDLMKSGPKVAQEWLQRLSDLEIITPFRQFDRDDIRIPDKLVYKDLYTYGIKKSFRVSVMTKIMRGKTTLATTNVYSGFQPRVIVNKLGKAYNDYYLSQIADILNSGAIQRWVEKLMK